MISPELHKLQWSEWSAPATTSPIAFQNTQLLTGITQNDTHTTNTQPYRCYSKSNWSSPRDEVSVLINNQNYINLYIITCEIEQFMQVITVVLTIYSRDVVRCIDWLFDFDYYFTNLVGKIRNNNNNNIGYDYLWYLFSYCVSQFIYIYYRDWGSFSLIF